MAEILYAFFCEDLRQEEGGKISAMGLMGSVLRVHAREQPGAVELAFHAYITNPEHRTYAFRFRLEVPGIETGEVRGTLSVSPGTVGNNLNIDLGAVPVTGRGTLVAHLVVETEPPIEKHVPLQVDFVEPTSTP